MFDQLEALAKGGSSDERRKLISEITNLFVDNSENYSDREVFLFGEVLSKLIENVDNTTKKNVSTAIAPINKAPGDLLQLLAIQDIDVADPILRHSEVLSDKELVEIANGHTEQHRLAISKRANLTAQVTDALLTHEEKPVLQSVCSNIDAEISMNGFRILAENVKDDQALCDLFSRRSDVPVSIVTTVIPLMSPEARARLLEISEIQGEMVVEDLINKARQQSKEMTEKSEKQQIKANVILEEIVDGKRELDASIELLCEENRPLDIGFILAGICNIPEQQVINALMKPDNQPIVILCRISNLSENTFAAIAELRRKRLKQDSATVAKVKKYYAEMDIEMAKRTIRSVKVRNMSGISS